MGGGILVQRKDKYLIRCILISLAMGLLCFGYFAWKSGGFFTLMDDFNSQELTFPAAIQTALKNGNVGPWLWNLDLGASLVTGFGFYNLGSIFFWISFLFPKTSFPYIVAFIYVLKYVAASAAAYCYIRYFIKDRRVVLIAALLYSFSGFQTTNLMFYHFHDVVAFFPLLLLGLEKMMESKKNRPLFVFFVFLNCITNYFFFIMEVIFLVIYFLFRFHGRPLKMLAVDILDCILCGALGVGMAAVLFVPNVLFALSSSRGNSKVYLSDLICDTRSFLFKIKGMILPGDNMSDQSILIDANWSSTSCYLPLFGLSFVMAYLSKKKTWLKYLIAVLLPVSFSPLLQSGFLLFTATYQRWWMMLILMMVLASAYVLEDWASYDLPRHLAIYGGFIVLFYLALTFMDWSKDTDSVVYHGTRFLVFTGIALAGVIILLVLVKMRKMSVRVVGLFVVVFCVGTTALTTHLYRAGADHDDVKRRYDLGTKLADPDDQYRYNTTDNLLTLTGNASGLGAFCSTMEPSSLRFDTLFDHNGGMFTTNKNVEGLPELLGGKYNLTQDASHENIVDSVESDGETWYIYETPACPIGYAVDGYITRRRVKRLPLARRAQVLMNALVIPNSEISKVEEDFPVMDPDSIGFEIPVRESVQKTIERAVQSFKRDSHGFTCTTDYADKELVFFTVPWSKGWDAYVDEKECEIIDACGMMAISLPAGLHSIEFRYHTPGMKTGILVTIASWCLFLILCILTLKKGRGDRASMKGVPMAKNEG